MSVYAHDGEPVTCEQGHLYGWFTEDVHADQIARASQFEYADGTKPVEGSTHRRCHCGARAIRISWIGGLQAFIGGEWRTTKRPNPLDGTRLWPDSQKENA